MAEYSDVDLSAAVDVYSDWIDACDAVARETAGAPGEDAPSSYAELAPATGRRRNSEMQIDRNLGADAEDDEDG